MTVTEGTLVSLEYTLKDNAGEQIESNVGTSEPLQYLHGAGQIVPGLEKELEGMKVGDSKQVVVSPDEGYGVIDPEAFVEVPKDKVPPEAHKIGAILQTMSEDNQVLQGMVSEIKEETVVLDFNHPFAGKTLHFEVKVLEVTVPEEQQN